MFFPPHHEPLSPEDANACAETMLVVVRRRV